MKIVAHGDSWFDYPQILGTGGSVIDHLQSILEQDIVNIAHHGDGSEVSMSLSKRKNLELILLGADYLLVSSGGDDIAGDQFCIWLNENTNGDTSKAIDWQRFGAALSLISADYMDLVEMRNRLAPNCIIVTHEYDFPIAKMLGDGVCTLGPWLKPSLDYCGWTNQSDQVAIVKSSLIGFSTMLKFLPIPLRKHIATQGTLGENDWSNEIHPNRQGFEKIATLFANVIKPTVTT